jgi:hypothetical protein
LPVGSILRSLEALVARQRLLENAVSDCPGGAYDWPRSNYRYFGPLAEPWIPEVGYVLHERAERQEALEDDLGSRDECSEIVPEIPQSARRKASLCFIGFKRGQISHVARAEIRYKARSGNDRLDIWKMEELPRPVSVMKLRAALKGSRVRAAKETLKTGGHLAPKAFQSVLEALERADPAAFRVADGLRDRERRDPQRVPEQARTSWALQRDAVVTALDIAKIPREELGVPPQPPADTPRDTGSIFDDVREVRGLEDILVLHDLNGAEGWDPIRSHKYPAKTFRSGDTVLTVVLANKLPLEEQLGIDLIYVNETLKSVVFVQYKVMKGADGEDGYRPDDQLDIEIKRMDEVATLLSSAPPDPSSDGYRLGGEAFFLKFCKGVLEHRDVGMVPGHYLPVGYWKRLATDPRVQGPRKGVKITPSNIPRYFTATDFKELVSRAWIGTSALQADIIVPLIKEIWQSKRAVVLAIKSEKPEPTPELDDILADEVAPATITLRLPGGKRRRPGQKPKIIQI